jgi:hypothetical protein
MGKSREMVAIEIGHATGFCPGWGRVVRVWAFSCLFEHLMFVFLSGGLIGIILGCGILLFGSDISSLLFFSEQSPSRIVIVMSRVCLMSGTTTGGSKRTRWPVRDIRKLQAHRDSPWLTSLRTRRAGSGVCTRLTTAQAMRHRKRLNRDRGTSDPPFLQYCVW